jgi:lysophospholipase L1-like esterase
MTHAQAWFRPLVLTLGLLVGFGFGEIALRAYAWARPGVLEPAVLRIPYLQPAAIPGLGFENRPGTVLVGGRSYDRGVRVELNRLGFRGPEQDANALEAGRGSDELRIALVGDSYTLGSAVAFEDTFGEVLEAELVRAGVRARVLNLGTGSYNAQQEAILVEQKLLAAGRIPDLLVWQFLLNDVWEAAHHQDYARRPVGPIERHLLLAWLIGDRARRILAPSPDWRVDPPRSYAEIRALMLKLYRDPAPLSFLEESLARAAQALRAHDVPAIFLYVPYQEMLGDWSEYDADLEALDQQALAIARRAGWTDQVSTVAAAQEIAFRELILDMDQDHHPNARGHLLIGETLARRVLERIAEQPVRFARFRAPGPERLP